MLVYIRPLFEYGRASDMPRPEPAGRPWRLGTLAPLRGPKRTLFVFDREQGALFVCGWDGSEILLPAADLAAFLDHCLAHRAGARAADGGEDGLPTD